MSSFSDFTDFQIVLTNENVNNYLPRPRIDFLDFTDFQLQLNDPKYIFPEQTETKDAYYQYNNALGFFIGVGYNIQPLVQDNTAITSATGWTISTVLTYDQLVSAAAASPAAGDYGHIQLYYYDSNPSLHNIMYIEVTLNFGEIIRLYCFEIV